IKNGLIFISNVTSAAEFTWLAEWAARDRLPIRFILFNAAGSKLQMTLEEHGFHAHHYSLRGKWMIPIYIAFFVVRFIFRRPRFVHCHLLEASLIGITAAWLAGVRKRIMTRHHGDLHHVYHPHAMK